MTKRPTAPQVGLTGKKLPFPLPSFLLLLLLLVLQDGRTD
jgi:hypothetical protein